MRHDISRHAMCMLDTHQRNPQTKFSHRRSSMAFSGQHSDACPGCQSQSRMGVAHTFTVRLFAWPLLLWVVAHWSFCALSFSILLYVFFVCSSGGSLGHFELTHRVLRGMFVLNSCGSLGHCIDGRVHWFIPTVAPFLCKVARAVLVIARSSFLLSWTWKLPWLTTTKFPWSSFRGCILSMTKQI